jgi:hypothetical protein
MAEAHKELRMSNLPNTPREGLARPFDAWLENPLTRSKACMPDVFVAALKQAAKAVLFTAEYEVSFAKKRRVGNDILGRHPSFDVDVAFDGDGVTCARVEAATRWLGLECKNVRRGVIARNARDPFFRNSCP